LATDRKAGFCAWRRAWIDGRLPQKAISWHIASTGDFDGNGRDDILWRNDNGAASIWDNAQIGSAHIISGAGDVPNDWHIV
jgi:FG-GAP repeat